jgi:ribose 5-phosphate isomerase A
MDPKQLAGERAVELVEDGMIVGLGSGSTAFFAIQRIGELVKQGLKITGVCTSENTRMLAERWKIPYVEMDDVEIIDLTIDGADEVDPLGNGIKGGGGALLHEKIVASNTLQNIWVIEKRKLVEWLGAFPLPVEILPFGYRHCMGALFEMGLNPSLRMSGQAIFRTDGGNYIADLGTGHIEDPHKLDCELKKVPGLVENGLFLNLVNKVVVANDEMTDENLRGQSYRVLF